MYTFEGADSTCSERRGKIRSPPYTFCIYIATERRVWVANLYVCVDGPGALSILRFAILDEVFGFLFGLLEASR